MKITQKDKFQWDELQSPEFMATSLTSTPSLLASLLPAISWYLFPSFSVYCLSHSALFNFLSACFPFFQSSFLFLIFQHVHLFCRSQTYTRPQETPLWPLFNAIRHTDLLKLAWFALTANMSHEIDLGWVCKCVHPFNVCVAGEWLL